jgi:hypothetical protein
MLAMLVGKEVFDGGADHGEIMALGSGLFNREVGGGVGEAATALQHEDTKDTKFTKKIHHGDTEARRRGNG